MYRPQHGAEANADPWLRGRVPEPGEGDEQDDEGGRLFHPGRVGGAVLIITIGGWSKLEGLKGVNFAWAIAYVIIAFYVQTRWTRGLLPMAAALAILLLILAVIAGTGVSGTSWFDREHAGFAAPQPSATAARRSSSPPSSASPSARAPSTAAAPGGTSSAPARTACAASDRLHRPLPVPLPDPKTPSRRRWAH